jgi:hypothetical protein
LPSLQVVSRLRDQIQREEAGLQDIAQVGALGADAQIIQHHVALGILELGGLALGLEGLLDGGKVLVTGTLRKRTR